MTRPAVIDWSFLLYVGAILGASYWFSWRIEAPAALVPFWKASGIVILGAYALLSGARLAALGLILSAAGDYLLALPDRNWPLAMAFFGAGHVCYGAAFATYLSREGVDGSRIILTLIALAFSIGAGVWFFPHMGSLAIPGLLYQSVLTLMVGLGLLARAPFLARLGAVLFMASDTLIGLSLYMGYRPFDLEIWTLYGLGQILIAAGLSGPAARYSSVR